MSAPAPAAAPRFADGPGGNPGPVTDQPSHPSTTSPTGPPTTAPGGPGEPTQDAPEPDHEHGHDSPDHYPTEDDPA